ncbi:MAG: glycosyltransferase family 4 protein [Terracidiphilus sp.]
MIDKMIVDARSFSRPIDGIGRLIHELFRAMSELPDSPGGIFLAPPGAKWPFPAPSHWKLISSGELGRQSATLGWVALAGFAARRYGCDACLGATMLAPGLPGRIRQAVIAHDITWRVNPRWFSFRNRVLFKETAVWSFHRANSIIAVSNATKRDLIEYLHIAEDRIRVVPPGVNPPVETQERVQPSKRFTISGKRLLLCVSSFEPRKNLVGMVRACSALPLHVREQFELVLVGKKSGYGWDELKATLGEATFPYRITGWIGESELHELYAAAYAFIYPSLYEGFGSPVLEAMAHGVPVIAGNNSSLPEVLGETGILCDTANQEELGWQIQRLFASPETADRLGLQGKSRSNQFSWKNTAAGVLASLGGC